MAQLYLSNRLKALHDAAQGFGDTIVEQRQLKLNNRRQADADAIARREADLRAIESGQRMKLGEVQIANAQTERQKALELQGALNEFTQADSGQVMGPSQQGDFQAGMADAWGPLKDRLRAKIFTMTGSPTDSGEIKQGREDKAVSRLRLSQEESRKQSESDADVGYKKALALKAGAEKEVIEKPVRWLSKADAEGNTYQENPVTGETRDTGRKIQVKLGTTVASKEEMAMLKTQAIGQIDELLAHPGFTGAVGAKGWSQGFGLRGKPLDGTSEADFISRLDQIQSGAFLQARQLLKGGGAITDFESKKAEGAMSRMSTAVGEKEFRAAAKDYKDALNEGLKKLDFPSGGGASGSWNDSSALDAVYGGSGSGGFDFSRFKGGR